MNIKIDAEKNIFKEKKSFKISKKTAKKIMYTFFFEKNEHTQRLMLSAVK